MISEHIDFARTRLTETEAESLDRLANAPQVFKDSSLKAETEQAWHATFIRSHSVEPDANRTCPHSGIPTRPI